MDILLATNHLQQFAGSEIVILEFSEYFRSLGHDVRIYANWAGSPMNEVIKEKIGVSVECAPERIFPFDYDLVYIQHQVAGLFDYRLTEAAKDRTAFVFGRLSRRSFYESGGWLHDRILADHIFANSVLTAEHLKLMDIENPITTFHNAAPEAFFRPHPSVTGTLQSITFVTNHADPAVLEAARILSTRFTVRHIGNSGSEQQLVTPRTIHESDLVVSIGKSVQYALVGRTPVFVYDHFGGPGYLDAANFPEAARYSFSGRCCGRKLDGHALADEIIRNYEKGVAFANATSDAMLKPYRLPAYLDLMLRLQPMTNLERIDLMRRKPFLISERMMAEHVRSTHVENMRVIELIHRAIAAKRAASA